MIRVSDGREHNPPLAVRIRPTCDGLAASRYRPLNRCHSQTSKGGDGKTPQERNRVELSASPSPRNLPEYGTPDALWRNSQGSLFAVPKSPRLRRWFPRTILRAYEGDSRGIAPDAVGAFGADTAAGRAIRWIDRLQKLPPGDLRALE